MLPLIETARKERRKHLVALPQYGGKQWWHFFRQIDLPHLCFHCTRVTVITKLARLGFTEAQTMAFIGHASATIHALYRKFKPTDVAHLAAALSTLRA